MAKKKKDKHLPDKIEKFTQSLRVALTREEVEVRAEKSAAMTGDRDTKEEEQKAAAKHAKSIVESIDAEIRLVSQEIRAKSTYRAVECERRYCYEDGMYREVRLDIEGPEGVLGERKLTAAELQRDLPFENPDANGKHDPNKQPKPRASGPLPPVVDAPPVDESWKALPITECLPGLGKRIYDGMEKLNLRTLGELIEWKNEREHRQWTDIEGLGESGATKIDDAMEKFWTNWSQRKPGGLNAP